jgi:hypothetical protein
MLDGDETDIDCGGALPITVNPDCPPCPNLDMCEIHTDCESLSCVNGVCFPPSCSDNVENGDETDMDCGGAICGPCDVGDGCTTGTDCVEKICVGDLCLPPLCTDGVKNGTESDIDCGGTCNANCPAGQQCVVNSDCTTGVCNNPNNPKICLCPAGMVVAPINGGGTYCIDSGEVSYAEYILFYNANPSIPDLPAACAGNVYTPSAAWPQLPNELKPVTYVDWCDAYSYCQYLGRHLCGKVGGGPNATGDFDDASQSEWFNACTAQGTNAYPYGDVYDANACNGEDPGAVLWAEGANFNCQGGGPGLFNMSGNAAEWEDSCDALDQCRVRGGSTYSGQAGLACAASDFRARTDNTDQVGIRCCL